MGLRNILDVHDETLRKICRPVENFDRRLHILLDDLADTARESEGAGIAAPQVGILRRVCVIYTSDDENAKPVYFVNPEIIRAEGTQEGPEGCLSVPNRTGLVIRPQEITVRAQDKNGIFFDFDAVGFNARTLCHEIDHLDGKIYTDLMIRLMTNDEVDEWERKNPNYWSSPVKSKQRIRPKRSKYKPKKSRG